MAGNLPWMAESFDTDVRKTIARCFPQLTQEELSTAVETFLGYIDIVNDVDDALQADPKRFAALTANVHRATVEAGQVEPTNQQFPLHA